MMSTYNMTIANPAMAPKGGGMAGLALLDPPVTKDRLIKVVVILINSDKLSRSYDDLRSFLGRCVTWELLSNFGFSDIFVVVYEC